MSIEALKPAPIETENTAERALTEEEKSEAEVLLQEVHVDEVNLRYRTRDEKVVSLRKRLRESGSVAVQVIIESTEHLIQQSKDASYGIYRQILPLWYAANSENSVQITRLLLNETINGNPDRSAVHFLLSVFDRVGIAQNADHLKKFAITCLNNTVYSQLNFNRDVVLSTVQTLLHIKNRTHKESDKEMIDQAISELDSSLIEAGRASISTFELERMQDRASHGLGIAFEREFEVDTTPTSVFDIGEDDWENDGGSRPIPSSDDYEIGFIKDTSYAINEEVTKRIEAVNSITLKEHIAPTAVAVIQLHMFNFLTRKPEASDDEIQAEFVKIQKLSDKEKEYSDIGNPLPTIGIELEVPDTTLNYDKTLILDAFHIPNDGEINDLHEVQADYSYSAAVQSRLIQELAVMGALPRLENGRIDPSTPLSLHVNFGFPKGMKYEKIIRYDDEIILLNDMLIYAFTSDERLSSRKSSTSNNLKTYASPSGKSLQNTREVSRSDLVRLELRANEFRDYPSYRMLVESQRLTAMLISFIKYKNHERLTLAESVLTDLWVAFSSEAKQYLKSEGVKEPNLVDNNPREARQMLRHTDLKLWSRFLVSDYSRKVAEILKEALPVQKSVEGGGQVR